MPASSISRAARAGLNGSFVLKANVKTADVEQDGRANILVGDDGFDWFFATKKVKDSLSQ